jgi:LmbE family N-acetylglucosaminyl deacetylase
MQRTMGTAAAFVVAVAFVAGPGLRASSLPQDRGAAGTWQKLLKLQTTASAMHTTAHPDDEHGGVITWIGRKHGARLALLTLNRGESGDNAIGPELFDGVGLIRTEELRRAGEYYGVDDQYFTTVVDYGFSKRLDEALDKWGRENVLRDVVRIVRANRPYVLVSRFQGNARDGHGNHQAAGLVTQEAYQAAGDPNVFPEQIQEGLRPWQPMKLYMGGVREGEDWTIRVNAGEYSPWLGDSYQNFSRLGLAYQRSQNGGRLNLAPGDSFGYYKRLVSMVAAPDKEQSFFDGIDTSLPALFKTLRRPAPAGAEAALVAADRHVKDAMDAFKMSDPASVVPHLAQGLKATREALARSASEPDAVFVLQVKEAQFMDAIDTALGLSLTAEARPAGVPDPTGPFAEFAPLPVMAAVVPGQKFEVRVTLANRAAIEITPTDVALATSPGWSVTPQPASLGPLAGNAVLRQRFDVVLADDVPLSSRPYFGRKSLFEDRYAVSDPSQLYRPSARPAATAVVRYTVAGVPVETRAVVRRREAHLPYGYEMRELKVEPVVAVRLTPASAVIPVSAADKLVPLEVEVLHNREGETVGEVALRLPAGWTSDPGAQPFHFARAGERRQFRFTVSAPTLQDKPYEVQAVARVGGREYAQGYDVIEHRDLETAYLYRPAASTVRGVEVKVAPGLTVGYVMGVGDTVPAGIAQLGAKVELLDGKALATASLGRFDAIVTGTRAYAVREDLKTYNQRLLDYVKEGGNLVVLYNTQEFVPDEHAPFPADLPARAEEVSEEDSPVQVLAGDHPVFHWPNRITPADFEGWVEQRGSKFWTKWDPAYTPMIETHDKGQDPQKGGWLWAPYGKGHYTYFAYAFHRQLPYGVPGAYRLLANVLSLGKRAR